jgi:three-Cys-motif partner protein
MDTPLYADREQTEVKHKILERYLSAFAPIVGDWAEDIAYIDCLAGPWKSAGENLEDTSFSKAIKVLRNSKAALAARGKNPSFRCLLIDNNPEAFKELLRLADNVKDIAITPKDWDFAAHVNDIVAYVRERRKSFPFFFIDPTGWELVTIDLIKSILRVRPGEVLINLMTSWIRRFLSDETKRFERLLGPDVGRLRQLSGDEQEEELVRCYSDRIRSTGNFEYVCTLPVMKSSQDAFHFWMVYGTRHPKGVEVFKSMEQFVIPFMHKTRAEAQRRREIDRTSQLSFLEPEATYVERRLSRLRDRNVELAKTEVLAMLRSRRSVLYDDAWSKAMQFSLVFEKDLRSWITNWEQEKSLRIAHGKPQQKFPHRSEGQLLEWLCD